MKYNIEWLKSSIGNDFQPKYLFFWGHTPKGKDEIGKHVFSPWYASEFEVDGLFYKSAEHWMMAKKSLLFEDETAFENIMSCDKVGAAKALGRAVKNYDDTVWNENKFDIVVEGNIHKFGQSKELNEYLLNTGDSVLVEASPVDAIWKIGLSQDSPKAMHPDTWRGENLLVFALMEARDYLIK